MTPATIEGSNSSYASRGLGKKRGAFEHAPTLGKQFAFVCENDGGVLTTGTVRHMRDLGEGCIWFKTNRTTYVLSQTA